MRLHTSLSAQDVRAALARARAAWRVTPDVHFTVFREYGSRTHARAFETQLGTTDKRSLPPGYRDQHGKAMHVRRRNHRALYAATWHEWGAFMAQVFAADPQARFGGLTGWGYRDAADFHRKTNGQFPAGERPVAVSRENNPDYVSPALRAAQEQLRTSEKLLNDKWADPAVFGPPPENGSR